MKYDFIMFDLDGTVTDPATGITNSVMYALDKFGIQVKERSELYKFIGPPLWGSFMDYYQFSKEQANLAVHYYREYFKDRGIFENVVYEGMEDLLKRLKESGRTVILATSKPTVFSQRILEHFHLERYFDFVSGSDLDGTRVNKDEVILYAIEKCGIKDLSRVIMIGDREYDMIGAKKAGVASMGVLYGYGDRGELENAGADIIVDSVAGIGKVLLAE